MVTVRLTAGGVAGHAQVDDGGAAAGSDLVHLGEFLAGGGEADLQALGFAGPAFTLGFADAGGQVAADFGQPWPLGGVGAQQRAADAGFSELTHPVSGKMRIRRSRAI